MFKKQLKMKNLNSEESDQGSSNEDLEDQSR